ncbi:MAG: cob(I)yrinic acid a,c-diamide adenosyltransferase [Lachnospiraceae bacterium]|nr:cob(I)yrinic acid a,c-diamide adenosyltransferase [Lachnospiraceae bacterium]
MIHMYSGDGKGKTSIVTGMAVRMVGAGKPVLFVQFMKGNMSSEIRILESLPQVTVIKVEQNFGFYGSMSSEDKLKITECHNGLLQKVLYRIRQYKGIESEGTGPELLVVLDEITHPCRCNLIDEQLLEQVLTEVPPSVELAMTGRNPKEYMVRASDYWSDLKMKKHPYEKNVVARFGIEY